MLVCGSICIEYPDGCGQVLHLHAFLLCIAIVDELLASASVDEGVCFDDSIRNELERNSHRLLRILSKDYMSDLVTRL